MNLAPSQNGPVYLAVVVAVFGVINTLVDIPQDTQTAISLLIVAVAAVFGIGVQKNLTDPKG